MAKINFGGVEEEVVTREEFPLEKAREVLKDEVVAVLGYGVQGPAQALNMRDNGVKVIVGQREGTKNWNKAVEDGWVPGETLFPVEQAAEKRDRYSVFIVRRRSALAVVEDRGMPQRRGYAVLLAWFFSHVQG